MDYCVIRFAVFWRLCCLTVNRLSVDTDPSDELMQSFIVQ